MVFYYIILISLVQILNIIGRRHNFIYFVIKINETLINNTEKTQVNSLTYVKVLIEIFFLFYFSGK
jgi:hypothetical protein